nr:MAG TPA: hypothetical protein [Caudoviricetes sp.]
MEFLVENKLFRVDKTVVTIRKEQPFTYYTRELDDGIFSRKQTF